MTEPNPTVIELDHTRIQGTLRCRAEDCDGSPLSPTSGWHMVNAIVDGDRFRGPCLFVCTTHLSDAEETLVAHLEANEARAWEVETFRMQNWTDDGRGSVYTVASGGGLQETLF